LRLKLNPIECVVIARVFADCTQSALEAMQDDRRKYEKIKPKKTTRPVKKTHKNPVKKAKKK
jgi:hypothetical protein